MIELIISFLIGILLGFSEMPILQKILIVVLVTIYGYLRYNQGYNDAVKLNENKE